MLSFDDDDHDVPRGVVEHDGVGFHTGLQDTRKPDRLTPSPVTRISDARQPRSAIARSATSRPRRSQRATSRRRRASAPRGSSSRSTTPRALHWDLRLEHEGTLASWAVPKGIPPDPRRNHLAVRTEDHPLEYLEFHGEIPAGEYGAGTMKIWDRGTYELHKFRDDEVMVTLHGERVQGSYVLFRTGGKNWMIHRMDPPAGPGAGADARADRADARQDRAAAGRRRALGLRDQVGRRARDRLRRGRAAAAGEPQRATTSRRATRSCARSAARWPATRRSSTARSSPSATEGRPSFQLLQRRMHLTSEHAVRRLSQSDPVAYVVFDLLWLDGHSLLDLHYERAARAAAAARPAGPDVADARAPRRRRRGDARGDARPGPGGRDRQAARLPVHAGQAVDRLGQGEELPPAPTSSSAAGSAARASARGRLGALVVGFYADGELKYAGRVGTGFSEAELDRLGAMLEPLARGHEPVLRPPAAEGDAVRRAAPRGASSTTAR